MSSRVLRIISVALLGLGPLTAGCGVESDDVSVHSMALQQESDLAPPYSISPSGVLTTYWAIESNTYENYCIRGGVGNRNPVELYDCPSGMYWLTYMQWEVQASGEYYKLINRNSGLCMHYTGTGSTDYYLEATCSALDAQLFEMPGWPQSSQPIMPKNASNYYTWPNTSASRVFNSTSSHTWNLYTQ